MEIRPLKYQEMSTYIELVKEISPNANIGQMTDRSAWWDLTQNENKIVFLAYIDDKVVGTASVLLEGKINRGTQEPQNKLKLCAHIEEVIVHKDYRSKGIGKSLIRYCIDYSKLAGAYKAILTCSLDNVQFYEKCGFKQHEISMRIDLD